METHGHQHLDSRPRWVVAVLAALGIQIGATIAATVSIALVLAAGFASWGGQDDGDGFMLGAVASFAAGVGLFVTSGYTAARIAGSRQGWLMLLVGPIVLLMIWLGLDAFVR